MKGVELFLEKDMKIIRTLGWLIVVIVSTLTIVAFLSPAHYEVAGIKIKAGVVPSLSGGTKLVLSPFGEIKARTHRVPLRLNVEVEGINQAKLGEVLNHSPTAKQYFSHVERDARRNALRFLLRLLVIASLAGLIGSLLLTRTWWKLIIASLVGMTIVGMLALGVYLQFNVAAFAQPELSGALGSAPWIGTAIEKRLDPLDTLREDVQLVARNLRNFVAKVEAWQPIMPEKGTVRVLVVSDIHNNPAAFSLISRIVKDFQVDFVIDAGDITDFGSPIEASLLNQIKKLDRPYLYVPGNHDSPTVVDTLRNLPQVTILDRQVAEVKGLLIYGQADPVSRSTDVKPASDKEMSKLFRQLEQQITSESPKALIVVVHDGRMAEGVIGKVPIILEGHTHKSSLEEKGKTTIVNAGTTGATGFRLFKSERSQQINYALSLLYIDPSQKKLVAVDSIEVTALEGDFVLRRNLIGVPSSHR